MVASTDFFEKKKDWSLLKDRIIGNYLKPYIAKILSTRKPLVIVDCFAGKGKTNHTDGLFLMVEQMNKAWKAILNNARGGMKILFDEFLFPDMTVMSHFDVEADILNSLSAEREILYEYLLVKLIEKYGISYYEKEYRDKIKGFEKDNKLVVRRLPQLTPKGKPARSWDYKKFKIYLRLI